MASDDELIVAWRDGNQAAGSELFERHFDGLYRFFSSKADANDVSDLVQKTLLGAVKARSSFRGDSSVRTFLFAIARRQLYRYWKGRSRHGDLDFGVSSVRDLGSSPSALAADREEKRLVMEALRRIPVDLQIALELHFWEELSGSEIAKVLEIPEGTVRSRLRRGLAALRDQVSALEESEALRSTTIEEIDSWDRALGQAST